MGRRTTNDPSGCLAMLLGLLALPVLILGELVKKSK